MNSADYSFEGFKDRLRVEIAVSGFTQEQIEEKSGIKRASIVTYLNGKAIPSLSNLKKLCELFYVSADYLVFGDEYYTKPETKKHKRKKRENEIQFQKWF